MKRYHHPGIVSGGLLVLWAALLLPAHALAQEKGDSRNGKPGDKADSLIAKQQALFDRIKVAEAWKITKGDPKVLIGVIDNGFDFFHPDLKGQLIPGFYYPGGYHTEIYENLAHGTQVASLVVARENNPTGMVGLAPRCRVLTASQGMIEPPMLKFRTTFMEKNPKATLADLQKEMMTRPETLKKFGEEWVHYQVDGAADAIRYLVNHGVRVINFSGGLQRSACPSAEKWSKLESAFSYAAEKGVVIVLAAGNDAAQRDDYPGRPDTVIVAGATLLNDTRWEEEFNVQGTRIKRHSKATNFLRYRARHPSKRLGPRAEEALPSRDESSVDAYERRCLQQAVQKVLAMLRHQVSPTSYRVFWMRSIQERTIDEVAAELHMTPPQVRCRFCRTRHRFRLLWERLSRDGMLGER
jgi:subtilisin family serine protease